MAHKHYSTGARSPTSRRNIWRHLCGPKPRKHYADSHLGSNGFGLNSPRVSLAQEGNRYNKVIRNTTTALNVRHLTKTTSTSFDAQSSMQQRSGKITSKLSDGPCSTTAQSHQSLQQSLKTCKHGVLTMSDLFEQMWISRVVIPGQSMLSHLNHHINVKPVPDRAFQCVLDGVIPKCMHVLIQVKFRRWQGWW